MNLIQYNFPTIIHFGPKARNMIASVLTAQGIKRPVIVTDKGLGALPIMSEMLSGLNAAGLVAAMFSGVEGNPVESQVTAGVAAFKAHKGDAIVAAGGGAAMDVAKAIALMAHHPGSLFDYEDGKPDGLPVDKELPFLVTVPTTAGTGSEVGRSTVISDDVTKAKKIMFSPRLMPARVFADPELHLGLPASVTAATGMDALTHLIEAFLAKGFHPMCEGIALAGIRLVKRGLVDSVRYAKENSQAVTFSGTVEDFFEKEAPTGGEHLQARGLMLMAAIMGGAAFQKGLGVNHSCAHALSTVCDMHHGLANGIMLDYTMRFNCEAVRDKFSILAEIVHGPGAAPESFVDWITDLKKETGIPATLTAAGISNSHIEKLVGFATKDACHPSNPRPVSADDFTRIFRHAFGETA